MVSKASDDLPDPDKPVITISLWRGSTKSTSFRLCWRAPLMMMYLSGVASVGTDGSPSAGVAQSALVFTLTERGLVLLPLDEPLAAPFEFPSGADISVSTD